MARLTRSLFENIQGGIGKQLVFKKYGDKTVVTSYPDMSNVKPSEQQKEKRKLFAEAVAYARSISLDMEKKEEYSKKVKAGESVYHFALKEYLKEHKKSVSLYIVANALLTRGRAFCFISTIRVRDFIH